MDLAGKVALVTGGSGDIGGAICDALAAAGADIAASYLGNIDAANDTVDRVARLGRRAAAVQLDQRDEESIAAAAAAVRDEFGRCDILINNAAWNVNVPFPDLASLDADTWDRVQETNVRGPYLLARELQPDLSAGDGGRIVNIGSIGGLLPISSSIAYSCSKAALIHLTHCLAVAMSPQVAVNCVAPGLVEGTRMVQRVPGEVVEAVREQAVLGRVPSPRDIASAAVMLCQADAISGQTIVVDGGMPGAMNFG